MLIIFFLLKQAFSTYTSIFSYWNSAKNDTKLITVAYSYVQLWPFEVKFSPKNVNMPVIKNKKNINLTQWFQYQNCTSLMYFRRK